MGISANKKTNRCDWYYSACMGSTID